MIVDREQPALARRTGRTHPPAGGRVQLKLYIAGTSEKSAAAVRNIRAACEHGSLGHFQLTVIDLRKFPQLARRLQIVALPMLVRSLPRPVCQTIGDCSDTDRLLARLNRQ